MQTNLLAQERKNDMSESSYYHIQGSHQINLSVGTLNTTNFSFSLLGGTGAGDPSPSANLEYMYGLTPALGIGAHFNFYSVEAQETINLAALSEEIFEDPLCFLACQTGITLGSSCNCSASTKQRVQVFTFALKGALHIKRFKHIDTYSSFIAGYSLNKRETITESVLSALSEAVDINVNVPTFIYHGSVGVRYYLSPQIALYGEYGVGNVHTLRLGGTYRFTKQDSKKR